MQKYACAEGGAHLPLVYALRLPEPNKKPNLLAVSLRFAPVIWQPSDLDVKKPCMEEEEERKKERNNNAKFSGHYVYPRTETVRAHALRSHQ